MIPFDGDDGDISDVCFFRSSPDSSFEMPLTIAETEYN